jgi:hypothetical protein
VELCKQVSNWGYKLNDNYADNFNPAKKNSVESLFEVQYSGSTDYDFWSDDNQASWLSTFMGPRGGDFVAGSYGWNQPTAEFINAYESNDKRKDVTVFYEGCPPFDGMQYDPGYSNTGYNVRKFLVSKTVSPEYNTNPSNFPVLRYADVLLMEAEALNELGRTSEAEIPLNQVRKRAGLENIQSGLSKEAFREKVLAERRIELAFEGHRWFDLIRIGNGEYAINFFHSIGRINASQKHLLLPIPQRERDANPNLTQNPGY